MSHNNNDNKIKYKDFFESINEARFGRYWSAYWLSPNGKFYEVYKDETGKNGHFVFAREFCENNGISFSRQGPEAELFKRRWVRITVNYQQDNKLRFDYVGYSPMNNTRQKKAIRDKANELGIIDVHDDKLNQQIDI